MFLVVLVWAPVTKCQNGVTGTSLVVQWLKIIYQCSRHEFDPWSGKIPHALGQLSLSSSTAEPTLCNKRNYHSEKPKHHN